jgi:hypothetical protein
MPLQDLDDLRRIGGLDHDRIDAVADRIASLGRVARKHHDPELCERGLSSYALDERPAIDVRHRDVDEQYTGPPSVFRLKLLYRGTAARSVAHVEAGMPKSLGECLANVVVIVDDQDCMGVIHGEV